MGGGSKVRGDYGVVALFKQIWELEEGGLLSFLKLLSNT